MVGSLDELLEVDVGDDVLGVPGKVVQRYEWDAAENTNDVTKPWDILLGRRTIMTAGYFLFRFPMF